MAIIRVNNPIHTYTTEILPQVHDMIGTFVSPRSITHIVCGKCGQEYTGWECPHCGTPTYIETRVLDAAEIAVAEAAGIDHTDKGNWDIIEKIAEVAREHYEDCY